MMSIDKAISRILSLRDEMPAGQVMLAGISGIDASGKGFIAGHVQRALEEQGLRCVLINVDGWFNLPNVRFNGIDIVLLEGIFLFKPQYAGRFDLKIWIECGFETALERAIRRSHEGLGHDEAIRAYERVYFPAQRLHLSQDRPRQVADLILPND